MVFATFVPAQQRPGPGPMGQRISRCGQGFTFIEIMVLVAIMGILAARIVPRVMGRSDDARVTAG